VAVAMRGTEYWFGNSMARKSHDEHFFDLFILAAGLGF
jgi:hypothetical protein